MTSRQVVVEARAGGTDVQRSGRAGRHPHAHRPIHPPMLAGRPRGRHRPVPHLSSPLRHRRTRAWRSTATTWSPRTSCTTSSRGARTCPATTSRDRRTGTTRTSGSTTSRSSRPEALEADPVTAGLRRDRRRAQHLVRPVQEQHPRVGVGASTSRAARWSRQPKGARHRWPPAGRPGHPALGRALPRTCRGEYRDLHHQPRRHAGALEAERARDGGRQASRADDLQAPAARTMTRPTGNDRGR